MLTLNQLKKLYTNSPLWMKKLYTSIPFDVRNGKEYRKWRDFLRKEIDIEEYELLKLKETVLYAYENTKYYQNLFNKEDIHPYDILNKNDFQAIPVIDKDIVRANYNDFLVTHYPKKKIIEVTTGGSSGTPMRYIQSKNLWSKELAYYTNFFEKSGYKPSMLKAAFKGGDFTKLKKDKYWIYNPVNNEVIFSPSHINKDTIAHYIKEINTLQPKYFHGFPSSLLFLIHHMKANNLAFNFTPNAIFLVSESFEKFDIDQISEFFACKVTATYGHSERLIFGESFGNTVSGYKIDKRYGHMELLDSDNNEIHKNSIVGELVGTGFDNFAMPLLRYKTGDFTSYKNQNEGKIDLVKSSRSQLYLDCNDNSQISFPGLIKASEMLELGIIKYQIVQEKKGEFKLYIIHSSKFKNKHKLKLITNLNSKVNGRLKFQIISTSNLFLTKRGKCKLLIKEY